MSAEKLEQLVVEAIRLPPSERMIFLESACAGDLALLRRLESMIQVHARAESLAFFTPKRLSLRTERLGQQIGPYVLRQELGEGGWGAVFLADQEKPVRRRVAVKVIKAGLDTRNVIARFEAEREALARMDHPNIAKVLDAGTTEAGRPYFVMELVSGARITDYCDQHQLSTNERLDLFIKVCQAVQHAHQKGIIHRDLKPSNILVAECDGMPVPKIIDFGIAKAIEGRLTDMTVYTQLHQFIGTPAYMSPEQVELSGLDIDTRSDIYSLGVLLYELLTGKTPFAAEELLASGLEQMSRIIREKEPPRPSTRLRTMLAGELATTAQQRRTEAPHLIHLLRGDLDWIVMKCLEKDRRRRYETANALALEIRRYLHNEPVIARPPTAIYKFQMAWRRNKGLYAACAIVAIALVTGLTAALLGWRTAQTQRDTAVRAGHEAERARRSEASQRQQAVQARVAERQQRQWSELNLYAADMDLAARALAAGNRGRALELLRTCRPRPGQEDLRGWEWRYLWKQCQGKELFTLTGHNGRVVVLAFSPDNKTLISGDTDGIVKLWDLDSMKEVGTCSAGRLIYDFGLAVAPDGQALFIGWRDGAAVYDGPSFARVRQLPGAKGPLALSPDGRMLVTAGSDEVIIWEPGSLKELHRSSGRQGTIPSRSTVTFSPDGSMVAIPLQNDGRIEVKVWDAGALRENGFQEPPVSVLQRGDTEFPVNGMVFSKHAEVLATGQGDDQRELQLWDPKTGRPLSPLESSVKVLSMRFLPDGKTLLTFGWEQNFRLWDISTRTNIAFLRVVPGHENEIWSTAVAPNGQMIASGSKDGMIKVWNIEAFQEQPQVKDRIDAQSIGDISFSQDGHTVYTVSLSSVLGSWDTETLQPREFVDLPRTFRRAAFSPQSTHLALGLTNGAIEVWRVFEPNNGPHLIRELLPPQPATENAKLNPVLPLISWSGHGNKLAAFVNDLYVWDIAVAQANPELSLPMKPEAIALSPDGTILATASGQRPEIQLWDVRTGGKLSECVGHREPIRELAFSPDGKHLVSANFENKARLWDVPSGRLRSMLTGHKNAVFHVAFSPDSRTLVTRDANHDALKLWHVQTGRELMAIETPFPGWGLQFASVKFSPDGALMAVALSPAQIRFFRAPSLAKIDTPDGYQAGKQ